MLVYRCPGANHGPSNTTYDYKGVDGPCPDGWHTSLVAAVAAHKGETPSKFEADLEFANEIALNRAELEEEARKLGIKLDSRNSDERLAERIIEAMDAKTTEA